MKAPYVRRKKEKDETRHPMTLSIPTPSRRGLCFERAIYEACTIPQPSKRRKNGTELAWCGDLFTHEEGALFVPLSEDFRALLRRNGEGPTRSADPFYLSYAAGGAREASIRKDKKKDTPMLLEDLRLGGSIALSHETASHLLFLRHGMELATKDRAWGEALLNDLTAEGFVLPPIVKGRSICTDSGGFEGDTLMLRTPDLGWRSFFVPSNVATDLNGMKIIYTDKIARLHGDLGFSEGAKLFRSPVPSEQIELLCSYFIDRHLERCPQGRSHHTLAFFSPRANRDFYLAGLLATTNEKGESIEGVLFSSGIKKTVFCGWGKENIFVPLSRKEDDRGRLHVTAHPEKAKSLTFVYETAAIQKTEPTSLPPEIEPLLARHFTRPEPRAFSPVSLSIENK